MTNKTGKSETKTVLKVRVLSMRQKGHSYRTIGRELGIGKSTVARYLRESLAELNALEIEQVGHLRQLELSRLDYMLTTLESEVDVGTPKALDTALKIQERRCKLLGLDAPEKIEQTASVRVLVE